jgi:glucose/arabinose dehydrogenase
MRRAIATAGVVALATWPALSPVSAQADNHAESLDRVVDPAAVQVPPGYEVDVAATDLTFPTDITFGPNGEMYVAEAGGHFYGTDPAKAPPARILQLFPDGSRKVIFDNNVPFEAIRDADTVQDIPEGLIGPMEGITYNPDNGLIYVAHRTRVSTLDPQTGEFKTIVDGLPVWGIFHNSKVVFDPEGRMVFEVSAQANAGYLDKPMMEVLAFYNKPNKHEIPCEDVTLTGQDLPVPNLFTPEEGDSKETGIYVEFGEQTEEGQTIPGEFICNGAFYRGEPDGTNLERLSWGYRDPYHYEYSPDGRLIATDNGGEAFGTRPVYDDFDRIWVVEDDGRWMGWPEYFSGLPITDERFRLPQDPNFQGEPFDHDFALTEDTRQRLLRGGDAPQPLVLLEPHIGAQGFTFGPPSFGLSEDEILLAEFGTLQFFTTKGDTPTGFQVSRVNIDTGERVPFMTNLPGNQPLSITQLDPAPQQTGGLERPLRPEFGPDGAMYLVDFGVLNSYPDPEKRTAFENTGVVWMVTRTAPVGGVDAGGGGTAGVESLGLFAVGGLALIGAAMSTAVAIRRRTDS